MRWDSWLLCAALGVAGCVGGRGAPPPPYDTSSDDTGSAATTGDSATALTYSSTADSWDTGSTPYSSTSTGGFRPVGVWLVTHKLSIFVSVPGDSGGSVFYGPGGPSTDSGQIQWFEHDLSEITSSWTVHEDGTYDVAFVPPQVTTITGSDPWQSTGPSTARFDLYGPGKWWDCEQAVGSPDRMNCERFDDGNVTSRAVLRADP